MRENIRSIIADAQVLAEDAVGKMSERDFDFAAASICIRIQDPRACDYTAVVRALRKGGVVELEDGGTIGICELASWEILEIADVVL